MAVHGDSYCGLYCGACSVLRHGETGRADAFVACLASVPAAELACGGCKSDRLYAGCRVCEFRDCARAKGIGHCVECADYPCATYRGWRAAGTILPHVREAPANLEAIRHRGADAWLAAQEKHWSCPGCGQRFSWYAARCSGCGRDLTSEAHALSGIRKLLCSWLIPLAYRKGKSKEPR